jgi:tape measure domain-containing protein
MASKQVQDLLVRLKIDGLEGLDSLKGAFRELAKTIGPTEQTIEKARQSIIKFGEAGNRSEQLIKGQIAALKGLQNQATQNGEVYNKLTSNIKALENVAYGASAAVEEQRKRLTAFGASADATALQVQQTINALIRLRGETRIDSDAFNKFGESVATLTNRFKAVSQEAQNFADAQRRIVRPIGASSAAAKQQIRDLELVTEALRDQRDELGALEGQARVRVGVAGLAERGAPASGRRTFEEALAESLFGEDIKKLLPAKDIKAALDEVSRQIVEFQQEIETNLSRGIQRSFQETARAGRESARAMAAAFSNPELLGVFDRLDQRLGELPQTATGFSQRLRELQQVFANTAASAENYISVALEIARVQRQASATAQGLGAALVRDLDTGVAVRNKKNLQEAIGQLQAEMNELDTQTTEGARAYAENANQARALESQLRQLGNSYRHVADMATQAATAQTSEATARVTANYMNRALIRQQEQAMTELGQRVRAGVAGTPLALPAAGQTSAPGTGLEISGGARLGGPSGQTERFFPRFELGDARFGRQPQSIGPAATEEQSDRARRAAISEADAVRTAGEARAKAEQQVQSYRAEIDKARRADVGSIESTQRLREAISQYRSTLPGTSNEFRKLTKEVGELDARSEKLGRGLARRRMGGMQMAQAAGAAISGGIFGGPEGFLGGAIGGLTSGVGGAFVGAAVGAQVGMLRQQLGGFADYAAQIQKMEIALKSAAGSQDQFNQAVAAANFAVRNLNVPQDVAIQGMTRLTAAVKGAGGQVSDAELVFKNVTSAIKATGGSAEDVDGAITAMVQVFSKGKVSAEELSGQLGERLPGAVTKFAKANDMTLPELQKALEQGQVGLNELMNFIVQLGDEYAGVAGQIASSSQDAGARLTVAFNDMRIAIGETLQPIGAQFQEAFAEFIEKITPALVAVLPKIAEAALVLVRNLDILAVSAGAAFAVFGVGQLAAIGGIGGALLKLAAAAGTASVSLKALNATALLNPWTALAAGVAAVGVSLYNTWREQEQFNELLRDAPLDEVTSKIDEVRQKLADLDVESRSASAGMSMFGGSVGFASVEAAQLKQDLDELISRQRELALYRRVGVTPKAGYAAPGFAADPPRPAPTRFPRLSEDSGGRAKKAAKERESQLPQLQAQLAVQQQIAQINAKIRDAQLAENQFLQIRLEGERELAQIAGEIKALAFEKITADEVEGKRKLLMLRSDEARKDIELRLRQAEKQNLVEITKRSDELAESYTAQIENRQRLQELVATGMKEALALEYIQIENMLKIEKERLETRKALQELAGNAGGAQETQDLIDRLGGKETGLKDLAAGAQETEKGKLQEFIEQAEAELRDLEALAVRISQNIGNAIGNSLANGLTGLIEGTTTAKQIFADFLKDVGQILIQEGAKMIATYIAIGIAKIFAGLASGGGGGGGEVPGALGQATSTGLDTGAGNISDMLSGLAAKGAYFSGGQANFAQNSIKPFATGGIVTKPTFFKYADGGTFNNGVMGEAGPEAIMPLKRGADGKLGVAARLDGAMKRYRSTPGSAAAAAEGDAASLAAAGAATMEPIDVRYSVERINSVDYVTADQFQRGMQQAAAQGAKQGEQRALSTLKQNTNVRRSVGI